MLKTPWEVQPEPDRLYGAVIAILVESSAIFVPWASKSWVGSAFWPFLFEVQVRAASCAPQS